MNDSMGERAGEADLERFLDYLPALPGAAVQALAELQRPEPELKNVAAILSADPVLSARVLRVANSPFYGLSGRIAGIRDACMVLGLHTVRALVTAAAAMQAFPAADDCGRINALWSHCAHTGLVAKRLAREFGQHSESAFITGLLHDIGAIAVEAMMPEAAREVRRLCRVDGLTRMLAEQSVLGFDHAAAGGGIARHWNLPDEIAIAIAGHHRPRADSAPDLCGLVHLANALSQVMERNESAASLYPRLASGVVEHLDLNDARVSDWMACLPSPKEIQLLSDSAFS